MRFTILAWCAIAFGGCCHPALVPVAAPERPACLQAPPPAEHDVALIYPAAGEEPADVVAVLDVAAAESLINELSSWRRYAREAWLRCGAAAPSRPNAEAGAAPPPAHPPVTPSATGGK